MRRPRQPNLNRLWIARKKAGLGQKVVSRLMGHKSNSPISEYEAGRLLPNIQTAFKLSAIYQTPLPELYPALYQQIEKEVEARRKKILLPQTNTAPQSAFHL